MPHHAPLQEAAYNIARAAHHLNLLHIAVPFYKRALAAPAPGERHPGAAAAAAAAAAGGAEARGDGGGAAGAAADGAGSATGTPAGTPPEAAAGGEEGDQAARQQAAAAAAEGGGPSSRHDLRREAAFNLSLIYRSSGADELARQVLRQHLTV